MTVPPPDAEQTGKNTGTRAGDRKQRGEPGGLTRRKDTH
jgi:hypothetical protein